MTKLPLHSLTALRYPAAVWVLVFHLHSRLSDYTAEPFLKDVPVWMNFIERGFIGVTFFFVLSGFILAYNYDRPFKLKDFYIARAARILPVYYLSLLIALPALLWQLYEAHKLKSLIAQGPAVLLLLQSWISASTFWNGPAWTLSCEVFFYAIFPVAMGAFVHLRSGVPTYRWPVIVLLLTALGTLPAAIFAHGFAYPPTDVAHRFASPDDAMAFGGLMKLPRLKILVETWPPFRVFEFLIGIATYQFFASLRPASSKRKAASILVVAGGAFLVFVSLTFTLSFPLVKSALLAPICALIILLAARYDTAQHQPTSAANASGIGVLLGQSSYSFYLLHMPIIIYSVPLIAKAYINLPLPRPWFFTGAVSALTLVTTAVSILVFKRFEEPARAVVRSLLVPGAPRKDANYVGV